MKSALIGGTGIDELLDTSHVTLVTTRFGDAEVVEGKLNGRDLLFVPRHGLDHSVLPSLINYRAQIAALKKLDVERVVAVCAVGSLDPSLPAGSFAVLSDFIDMTRLHPNSFFGSPGDPVVHTDFSKPYCGEVSQALIDACNRERVSFKPNSVYVGVDGPRYETPAEIRLYASWGTDVVGMTNLPEVVLAREAGLCYGALAVVSNLATGLSPTPLNHEEVRNAVAAGKESLFRIISGTLDSLPGERQCRCSSNTGLVI